MKKLLSTLMLIAGLAVVSASSVAQNSFSYQSVIRNNGEVVSNQDVALRVSILNGSDVCYQETHQVKTNAYGNISISVGEGEPKTGTFAAIPWETMQIMMQIEVSTDGTENYVNLGQMQIQPVPYTMYAARTTTVIQPKEATEDPIFEVRDSEGELLFAVYETGVKVFVDEDGSKAAKSKFAVAGRSVSKGEENLLAIDADGTTVFVDDNADKAAKSRFAVAERSAKGDNNIITIDGSGSTIYVSDEGKAAKSKFAVAERSAKGKKSGNNYSLDGDGSTVYVDFDANASKGNADVLSIDGGQATFYIDDTEEGKAAKSRFAVAGRSAKDVQTAFAIDGSGTVIYIDEWDNNSKAAKSTFAVAGLSSQKGNNNFFIINRDSTRIYVNDEPAAVDTVTGEVIAPSLASAFTVVGMTQKTDMLVVNRDSTIVKMNTYVEEQMQSTSGVVEKIVDDKVAEKVYSTGMIEPYFSGNNFTINIFYTYYHSELGEYLYLKYHDVDWENNSARYEYRNYWLVDGKIYRDTTYFASNTDGGNETQPVPIYEFDNNWKESYVLEQEWNGKGILTVLESEMRKAGYKLNFIDSTDYYYDYDAEDWQVMVSKRNTVTALSKPELLLNNMSVLTSLIEPASVFIHGNDTVTFDEGQLYGVNWESYYTLFDDNVNSDKILAAENENSEIEHNKEYRKQNLNEIETMLAALKKGFTVTAKANNPEYGSIQLSPNKERYSYGETVTLTPVIDKHVFTGWSDGCTDTVRTICVMGDASYTAIFEEPVLFVSGANNANDENYGFSADKPLASIDGAIEKIKQTAMPGLDWTINIVGTLQGPQTIEGEETTEPVIYYYGQIYNVERTTHTLSTNSITIKGYGANATLLGLWDGENEPENSDKYSVLTISTNDSIIIENLTITSGYAGSGGGICANDTKLTIGKGCNITNNRAVYGGGIYISRGKLVVNGGSITYNKAETSSETFVDGGGIYACGVSDITINDGDISYNTGGDGGGICLNNDNNYEVYMINDNDFESTKSKVIINGGTISHNEATYCKHYHCAGGGDGGGICVQQDAVVIMTGGSITDNVATDNEYDEGGGIYIYAASFIMTGGIVSGNKASTGNGVYLNYASSAMGGGAKIDDETCLENTTITVASPLTSDIAAVITPLYNRYNDYYQHYTENEILIKPDTVSDEAFSSAIGKFAVTPKVSNNDTTMYYIGTDAKLKKYTSVRFRNCEGVYAQYLVPGFGQKIKNPGTPSHSTSTGITYTFKGWYVMNDQNEYVSFDFDNTTVSDNDIEIFALWNAETVVSDKDGAISSIDNATNGVNVTLCDYTIFVDGKLTGNQSIYNSYMKSLTITGKNGLDDNGMPKDSICGDNGCALSIYYSAPITISNLKITGGNNTSNEGKGGGLYIYNNANVTLESGAFVGDTSTQAANSGSYANIAKNGGGVYIDGGTLTLKNGSVIGHNYATANEVNNSNEGGGGVFVARNGILNIEPGAKIVYNGSGKRAGGVLLAGSATVTMTGGEISHNETGYFGGGVLFASSGANGLSFNMSGGTISNNKVLEYNTGQATAGGGVFVDCGTFTMSDSASITGNESTINGGGIRAVSGATINMLGGTVTGNTLSKTSQNYGLGISLAKNAQLNIGGSAYVDANNDVYLAIDEDYNAIKSKVVVASALSHTDIVATITPANYDETVQALWASEGFTLSDWVDKFAIKPNGSIYWSISATGLISPSVINADTLTTNNISNYLKIAVTSAEGMNNISNLSSSRNFSGKTIILENDVTLNASFTAICLNGFKGTFDGNNHTISGLNGQTALFGKVDGGTIKNLTVEGSSTKAGIASEATGGGVIEGCTNKVNVTGTKTNVGGIVGIIETATIRNCVNEGAITSSNGYLGGIVGRVDSGSGTVESCVNKGTVTYTGSSYVLIGGICGDAFGTIRNCINAGEVNGGNATEVGGIAGDTDCNTAGKGIFNCANIGTVSGKGRVGGVAGTCDISGSLSYDANVFNCYNADTVKASNGPCGAVVGEILTGGSGTCTLTHNYYKPGTASVGVSGKSDSESNSTASVPSVSEMDTWVNDNNSASVYKTWTTKDGNPVPDVGYDW